MQQRHFERPREHIDRVDIPVTGGSGDGSNTLRFETVQGTGWGGTLLHDIQVN